MHIVFQFPIVDARSLLANGSNKLPVPEWPDVGTTPIRFIRHFGSVEQRNAGGSDDWPGEGFFCNSHLAMRYDNLHKHGFEFAPGIKSAIFNSYRRYASAENFLGRVEAGFVDNIEGKLRDTPMTPNSIDFDKILEHYCDLPVSMDDKEYKLSKVGQRLADNYYRESTLKKVDPQEKNKLVRAGDVAIVMVYAANKAFQLPDYAFPVDEFDLPGEMDKLKLYGCRFKYDNGTYKVWMIETPVSYSRLSRQAKATIRNLRINLLRIHLEKETIRILLNGIKSNQIPLVAGSDQAKLADKYFEETGKKIFEETRFTINQKNLLDFALKSEDSAAPGTFNQLEEGIYKFKDKYVQRNIDKLLTGMAKKTILFICTSPKGVNPLDFGEEYSRIKKALRAGTDRDNYEVEIEAAVKRDDLGDILTLHKPDYLHLSMHSSLKLGLYFEDRDKEKSPMAVDEFAAVIKNYSTLHKPVGIILSACNSKAHAEAVKPYCNFAVGTQKVFPADAGVIYATKFYSTLFENNSSNINYCHDTAILAIKYRKPPFEDIEGLPVDQIPVLL
jgi:hypothetical protein